MTHPLRVELDKLNFSSYRTRQDLATGVELIRKLTTLPTLKQENVPPQEAGAAWAIDARIYQVAFTGMVNNDRPAEILKDIMVAIQDLIDGRPID